MCMTYGCKQESKIATKNLTVFKCMEIYDSKRKMLRSPYRYHHYEINNLYVAPRCALRNQGGFYSFKSKKDAKLYKKQIKDGNSSRIYIYKCIIPKGSRYITGTQHVIFKEKGRPAIRSKQIIFQEMVK